jgi:hypothetical protein
LSELTVSRTKPYIPWLCNIAASAPKEPEDKTFVFRWWADLQFLIVALRRLRRAAQIASAVPSASEPMAGALRDFDEALPDLQLMRNVGEHIDDYVLETKRRRHPIDRRLLQVGTWDGTTFTWLKRQPDVDAQLNIDAALGAAENLYLTVRRALEASPAKPAMPDS